MSECTCKCHVSSNGCCALCFTAYKTIEICKSFYAEYGHRLKIIEDLFEGKSFKPIHDAMELHVEKFNERISKLEQHIHPDSTLPFVASINTRLEILENMLSYPIQLPDYKEQINKLEKTVSSLIDKIAEIANYYYRERQEPYKCPACEGLGYGKPEVVSADLTMIVDGIKFNNGENILFKPACKPCGGKGVLWK